MPCGAGKPVDASEGRMQGQDRVSCEREQVSLDAPDRNRSYQFPHRKNMQRVFSA